MPPTAWVSMTMLADVMAQAQLRQAKVAQVQPVEVGNDNADATQAAFREALDYLSSTLFSHLRSSGRIR